MRDLAVVLLVLALSLSITAIWWLLRANYRLAAANEEARHDVGLLQIACDEARTVFSRYAALHAAKNTAEGDKKAHCNASLATALAAVLKDTGFDNLGPMQKATLAIVRDVGESLRVR